VNGYGNFVTKLARDLMGYLQSRQNVNLEDIDHLVTLPTFDLGKARTNEKIYNRSGCRIFVTSLTGTAYLRSRITGQTYPLFLGSMSFPFKKLYLTNDAQAGKTLSIVIGLQSFVDLDTQPEFSSAGLATQTTLALIKAKTDNLDVALSTLATDAGLAAIAGLDFAEQTTLALIKAKTDNLNISISALRDAIRGGDERTLTSLFDTLILIKAKTDLLDNFNLSVTSLRDAIDGADSRTLTHLYDKLTSVIAHLARINSAGTEAGYTNLYDILDELETIFDKLDSLSDRISYNPKEVYNVPTTYNVTMANADHEYSQALPAGTKQITFFIRGGNEIYRYAWVTGKVATPTAPYTEIPANGIVFLDKLDFTDKTLYFACPNAGNVMQIEVLT